MSIIEGAAGINASNSVKNIGDAELDPVQDVNVNISPGNLERAAAGETIRLGFGGLFRTNKLTVNAGGAAEEAGEAQLRLLPDTSADRQPIEIGLTAEQIEKLRETKIVLALPHEIWTQRAFVKKV